MQSINVKVMLGTLANAGDNGRDDLNIAAAVLADSDAKNAVSVVGVQWGVLDKVNLGTATFQGLPVWATEHRGGNYPWMGTYNTLRAPNDQAYALESWGLIRDAITKGKVTAYDAWNMVLDKVGLGIDTSRDWKQNALLVVDTNSKLLSTTQAYYVFRHFSQFVRPGAKVLKITQGDAVAFRNPDNSTVVVMYNAGASNTAYPVQIGDQHLQFSLATTSWATVALPP